MPVLTIPLSISVVEGQAVTVPITKTGSGACSVKFRTRAIGSAAWQADYAGTEQTVTFASGDKVKTVTVQTVADVVTDPGEKFQIELTAPSKCTILNPVGTVVLVEPPKVSIQPTASVKEGDSITVTLTKSGAGACSVTARTQQVTAKFGVDYAGSEDVVSFGEADTTRTFIVPTKKDASGESAETFKIVLEKPAGCVLGNAQCTVALVNVTPPVPVPPPVAPIPDPLPEEYKPTYPRAYGFATEMNAGEGQPIYYVTTLADSGPGSLRDGCTKGNALVVFEIGGAIMLKSELSIGPNTTIAGETAPKPGITVQGKEVVIRGNNVRVSHVVFERGHDPSNTGNDDAMKINPSRVSSNIHIDHCAFFWATDETVQLYPSLANSTSKVSFSDCMFCEPLWRPQRLGYAAHEKVASGLQAQHNYGLLIAFKSLDVDLQYSLHTECDFRVPWIDHSTRTVLANNIALNCTFGATIQCNHMSSTGKPSKEQGPVVSTCVGYLMISGPSNSTHSGFRFHTYPNPMPTGSAVHVAGLYGWKGANSTATPGTKVEFGSRGEPAGVMKDVKPIDINDHPVSALSADGIYARALANIGPRPKERANPNVARQITKLREKKGSWVDHQTQVNGTANLGFTQLGKTTRSLRDGSTKFASGEAIPAFPTSNTAANAKAWLRRFKDEVSLD